MVEKNGDCDGRVLDMPRVLDILTPMFFTRDEREEGRFVDHFF